MLRGLRRICSSGGNQPSESRALYQEAGRHDPVHPSRSPLRSSPLELPFHPPPRLIPTSHVYHVVWYVDAVERFNLVYRPPFALCRVAQHPRPRARCSSQGQGRSRPRRVHRRRALAHPPARCARAQRVPDAHPRRPRLHHPRAHIEPARQHRRAVGQRCLGARIQLAACIRHRMSIVSQSHARIGSTSIAQRHAAVFRHGMCWNVARQEEKPGGIPGTGEVTC
ncbi:hypothetical protein CC85DRAFT_85091 [Cutaneotrichosporon oleaginosum]|uniref:Uncharacterized protein n=1 Tax=Cutaneotrichosporon oleaginosum TaxID=879819 RepID=A0A0J0XMV8_9TREE|nr:uncharacterized protein CC85DRAFT_85091 [Cutaneotrichosporon oleaginosum]KLT42431.1 hypothetical protein CC85DRAFT_85091 [Cutaneotrichosporon oleaginosum]TXT06950.1 hypothetical protein COLE_06281 [Cutaneotrichosporon oleaginosum]